MIALYDSRAIREFAGIDLSRQDLPDAATLLKFRRRLEGHDLGAPPLAEVNVQPTERGSVTRQGGVVDATIIAAPATAWSARSRRRFVSGTRASFKPKTCAPIRHLSLARCDAFWERWGES